MSTQILPIGEIILTNERGLIGAGYDYQLRSGPGNAFDTGSFGLPISDIRRLRFDHCFIITPESIPWVPDVEDLKGFFHFVLSSEEGEIVTDVKKDFSIDPKSDFSHIVHYIEGHNPWYNIPAEHDKTPDGKYTLTCFVNPLLVVCQPVSFFLEIMGENIWMYAAPVRSAAFLVPFREGVVTREMLNPAAPPPKPA